MGLTNDLNFRNDFLAGSEDSVEKGKGEKKASRKMEDKDVLA